MQPLSRRLESAEKRPRPSAPVPVVLTITELDVGGAERAMVALATGLDPNRWRVSVLALGPEGPLAAPIRATGLDCECLGVSHRRPLAAVRRLADALRARRPLLVQSFLFHANVCTRLAARRLEPRPWVVGGLRVADREHVWHLTVERLTGRFGAGWVCVSNGVRTFSAERARLEPERLVVIPNGIDVGAVDRVEPASRLRLGVPEAAHLALFVGRLERQKGIGDLLEAARTVARARPDWQLLMVGDGPLRDLVTETLQADRVLAAHARWLGARDDVPSLMRAADVLVLPSLWEGMPNVVLEAMAAGKPVVGTEVEGTSELVRRGQTGWLVPPGQPSQLATALIQAASDPDRLSRYGLAGREIVRQSYSLRTMVAQYDRLWSRVLSIA